jgi:hypothetical protein
MSTTGDLPFYYEFVSETERSQLEQDLRERRYRSWVEKYPDKVASFFGALMFFAGYNLTKDDVAYFADRININLHSNVYPSELGGTTPLCSACEFRNINLVQYLLEKGADPNLEDNYGFTPLESAIVGHQPEDVQHTEECEKIVRLLIDHGAQKTLREIISKNPHCDFYRKNSPYLAELFQNARPRQQIHIPPQIAKK